MPLIRKNALIRQVKDITVGSALTLSLLGTAPLLQSCNSGGSEQYETVYERGVRTHVREEAEGVFKITREEEVAPEQAGAVVTYRDGRTETLSVAQAQQIVREQADTTGQLASQVTGSWESTDTTARQEQYRQGHFGLGNVLFYGGLGYLMGRQMGMGPAAGFYNNPAAYQQAQQTSSRVQATRTTRPAGASRGYFRNSGRSGGAS